MIDHRLTTVDASWDCQGYLLLQVAGTALPVESLQKTRLTSEGRKAGHTKELCSISEAAQNQLHGHDNLSHVHFGAVPSANF